MIDRELARDAFARALISTPRAWKDLRRRCLSECRGMTRFPFPLGDASLSEGFSRIQAWCRAFGRWVARRRQVVADAWLRQHLKWLRDDPSPQWLQEWAEKVVHQLLWQGRLPKRFHPAAPDVTLDTVPAIVEKVRALSLPWRHAHPDDQPPRPREEPKNQFLARMTRAYDTRRAALATEGLLERKRAFERHTGWYVRACIIGHSEAQIVDDHPELDLSTVKKGIDDFAALSGLPPRPKRSFTRLIGGESPPFASLHQGQKSPKRGVNQRYSSIPRMHA